MSELGKILLGSGSSDNSSTSQMPSLSSMLDFRSRGASGYDENGAKKQQTRSMGNDTTWMLVCGGGLCLCVEKSTNYPREMKYKDNLS